MRGTRIEELEIGTLRYQRFEVESSALQGKTKIGIIRPNDMKDRDIAGTLYFFHAGIGDDRHPIASEMISSLPQKLVGRLAELRMQIVLPFIGLSCLSDPSDLSEPSYFKHMTNEVMAWAEGGTQTSSQGRFLAGASAGGFAALQLFLKRPSEFAGCGTHFPIVLTFDYTNENEVQAYQARSGADPNYLDVAVRIFKDAFESFSHAQASDPLELLKRTNSKTLEGKRIYLDVGSEDEFGLTESSSQIQSILLEKSVEHEFRRVEGGRHDEAYLRSEFPRLLSSLID